MEPICLVIVGAGPTCTYVIERLAATVGEINHPVALELHIFDKTGQFGSGQVHSTTQPSTSFLNRIAAQVGFGADESVIDAGPLFAKGLRPTLYEWCRNRFVETGDPDFDLTPEDWPKRYVHGFALQDMFRKYVQILERPSMIRVHLHPCEVIDVIGRGDVYEVLATPEGPGLILADHILFATGHSYNDPHRSPELDRLLRFGERHAGAVYVPTAYPIEKMIPENAVSPVKTVGCVGMGLTAIDVILYLTEGRGGAFDTDPNGNLVYRASGSEPASIVAFGNTGLFTFARPYNAKEKDPERLEHRGVFLTRAAILSLRASAGVPIEIERFGVQRQIDFERHVFPILLLEMAYVYYKTLLGADFGQFVVEHVTPCYQAFLAAGGEAEPPHSGRLLLQSIEETASEALDLVDRILSGQISLADARSQVRPWSIALALDRYVNVVFGPEAWTQCREFIDHPDKLGTVVGGLTSPFRHARIAGHNRFDWDKMIRPISVECCATAGDYREAMLAFMERDHLWAAQNNLDNPAKAAADGVWRDLRQVLAFAVDFGGLTAESHRKFLSVYMRHHNRLANGAALEVMQKIRALIEYGLLDVSIGPDPTVGLDDSGRFRVKGPHTGAARFVDTLIDAKVHPFDPELDAMPMYQNLYRRGYVRRWRNPSHDDRYFEPGGLDLSSDFHPVRSDGGIDHRMTFLGPPTEGVMFFQLGALRPGQNHHVMQDVLCWVRSFWKNVEATASSESYDRLITHPNKGETNGD